MLATEGDTTASEGDLHVVTNKPDAISFVEHDFTGTYGDMHIDAKGHWTYTIDNAKADSLKGHGAAEELFMITTSDGATQQVRVTLNGVDDRTVIGGQITADVTEDGVKTTASGVVSLSDVDTDVNTLSLGHATGQTAQTYEGAYGNLVMQEDGHWSYQLGVTAEQSQRVDALDDSDTQHDNFNKIFIASLNSATGASGLREAQGHIDITVHGHTDGQNTYVTPHIDHDVVVVNMPQPPLPQITETTIDPEKQSIQVSGDKHSVQGELAIQHPDGGETYHWAATTHRSNFGDFQIDKDGHWSYTADHARQSSKQETEAEMLEVRLMDSKGHMVDSVHIEVDLGGFTGHGNWHVHQLSITHVDVDAGGQSDETVVSAQDFAVTFDAAPDPSATTAPESAPELHFDLSNGAALLDSAKAGKAATATTEALEKVAGLLEEHPDSVEEKLVKLVENAPVKEPVPVEHAAPPHSADQTSEDGATHEPQVDHADYVPPPSHDDDDDLHHDGTGLT